jgi:hypothetical protein
MSANGKFAGLTMPVFTAFGWAGEENAIKFALSELELFIQSLFQNLSEEARSEFPHYGINREGSTAYLASKREIAEGLYIAFNARPNTFEMRFSVTDKAVLNRGLRAGEKSPVVWHRLISELGENWSLHIQQHHIDEDSGESAFYQDIFKNDVTALFPEECETITNRAAFLNSEVKWLTPFHISFRITSEIAAGMKSEIILFLRKEIDRVMPIIHYFTRSGTKTKAKSKKATKTKTSTKKAAKRTPAKQSQADSFSYAANLKPLHIRKGFVNLTPEHWPFFSTSARSELREITVYFDGKFDKECAIWRMQPNDMARLVLSNPVHRWLEKTFDPESEINIQATKLPNNEIQVNLSAAS